MDFRERPIASERGTRRDDIRPSLRTVGLESRVVISITAGAWHDLRQQMSLVARTMKSIRPPVVAFDTHRPATRITFGLKSKEHHVLISRPFRYSRYRS